MIYLNTYDKDRYKVHIIAYNVYNANIYIYIYIYIHIYKQSERHTRYASLHKSDYTNYINNNNTPSLVVQISTFRESRD